MRARTPIVLQQWLSAAERSLVLSSLSSQHHINRIGLQPTAKGFDDRHTPLLFVKYLAHNTDFRAIIIIIIINLLSSPTLGPSIAITLLD